MAAVALSPNRVRPDIGWAAPYLAVPFREHGRTMRGVDCWGLLLVILERELGLVVPDAADLYPSTHPRDARAIAGAVRAEQRRWVPCDVAPFAALLFQIGGLPVHVGVSLGGRLFIHARQGAGVMIADLDEVEPGEGAWGKRLTGAWRYDG